MGQHSEKGIGYGSNQSVSRDDPEGSTGEGNGYGGGRDGI